MLSRLLPDSGRGSLRSATAVGMLVLALGAVLAGCGRSDAALPSRDAISSGPELSLPPLPPTIAAEADQQVADPVRVRIPVIGVDDPVGPLLVDENGVLPPPDTNEGTGWWKAGPEPGERGPAVIAGHVDSYQGPAVFFRLHELETGDEIFVDRTDGSTAVFATQRVERHDKNSFPTEAVYGDTPDPQLRLITCGGEFDSDARRYLDNVIVYALRAG